METGQITDGVIALVALLTVDYQNREIEVYHCSDGAHYSEVVYPAKQLKRWSLNCLIRLCERRLYYRIKEIRKPILLESGVG